MHEYIRTSNRMPTCYVTEICLFIGQWLLLVCARLVVAQCFETYSIQVFDGSRLGGGRQDDQRVFSPSPGQTVPIIRTMLALSGQTRKNCYCYCLHQR